MLGQVTRVSWETKAQFLTGDRRLGSPPGPQSVPMIFVGNLEDVLSEILHEIQQ